MSDDNTKAEGKKSKTGPIGVEEHFKFLIACIRHGVNGKASLLLYPITTVMSSYIYADQLRRSRKGMFYPKRYERLMKAHDISPQPPPSPSDASAVVTATKRKPSTAKETNTAAKKRKATESDNVANGDHEQPAGRKKQATSGKKSGAKVNIKEEEMEQSPGAGSTP
ncbi:MAG: hypothetical protein Q9182_001010 [Xanthomendoza sp. 2 TL-2023]